MLYQAAQVLAAMPGAYLLCGHTWHDSLTTVWLLLLLTHPHSYWLCSDAVLDA